MRFLRFLQEVDRRMLYGLLILAVALPFLLHPTLHVQVSPQTQALYDVVDRLPPRSFVLIAVDWEGGSRGENQPQTYAILRHLMKRKLRFAMLSLVPQGKQLGQRVAERLQERYGYREGRDWVNWGYIVDQQNFLKAMVKDVPGTVKADIHGTALTGLPVMEGVHTAEDIKLMVDITPINSFGTFISFLTVPYKIPMGLCPTAVMAPEAFTYLDSGQLIGLVNGIAGAAEYEQLLREHLPESGTDTASVERATQFPPSLSAAHMLIITFIILGNAAMLLERRARARQGGRS